MEDTIKKYEGNVDFQEFLNREFDHTAVHSTMEEMAEFAFGSWDAAIAAYEQHKKDVA